MKDKESILAGEETMKELQKLWKEIEDKLGLTALELIKDYYYTLIRKIEDLTTSRDKWKQKHDILKVKLKEFTK